VAALRAWAEGIAGRRGKKIAMVALARRLARILYAMWRDEVDYQPTRQPTGRAEPTGPRSRTAA
jgi:transposase